jgi:hypothetical protein
MDEKVQILMGCLLLGLADMCLWTQTEGMSYRPIFAGLFLLVVGFMFTMLVTEENEY